MHYQGSTKIRSNNNMKTAAILYGRNDDYKEDDRAVICITSLLDTFDEVWYIDWNSPEQRGSLLWQIEDRLPKTGRLKHIVIPPSIVKQLTPPDASVGGSVLPNNIGIRRCDADWIVVTTMDIIAPNKDTFNKFLSEASKEAFYTLSRRDIEYDEVMKNGIENWKAYRDILDKTTKERRFTAKVTPNDNYSLINCCGDFQLASKEVWNKIKGYEEQMYYACFPDTNIQKKAILNNFDLEAIFHVPLYHMSHTGMANDGTSPSKQKYNDAYEWVEWFEETRNTSSWGLANANIEIETF